MRNDCFHRWLRTFAAAAILMIPNVACLAQSKSGVDDLGTCTLRDHIYKCDGAAFQKALASANTIAVETHNADAFALSALRTFITGKLGKTVAEPGQPADLVFLMIPTPPEGIVDGSNDAVLGTLRIYTATSQGARGHLLWAETYSGQMDIPWPAVVRRLLLQLQGHLHLK